MSFRVKTACYCCREIDCARTRPQHIEFLRASTIAMIVLAVALASPVTVLAQACIQPENPTGQTCTNATFFEIFNSTFTNNGTFNNASTLIATTGATFSNNGTLNNDGNFNLNRGSLLLNNGIINNRGSISMEPLRPIGALGANSFINNGVFNNYNSASLVLLESDLTNRGTINNSGSISLALQLFSGSQRAINNTGTINNNDQGTLSIDTATSLNNSGIFNNNPGSRVIMNVPGSFFNQPAAIINNSGTFNHNGEITNSGSSGSFNNLAAGTFNSCLSP